LGFMTRLPVRHPSSPHCRPYSGEIQTRPERAVVLAP
jgi:hypothetical protein